MTLKEIEIPQTDLEKIKKIELEMLIEFDRICCKHSIKYNLSSGTLLGAVRHKGIIPLDGLPKGKCSKKIYTLITVLIRKSLYAEVGIKTSKTALGRLGFRLLSFVPPKVSFALADFLTRKYDEHKSSRVSCMGIKFEGHMVYAPKDFDAWLRQEYGDYMKLPPIDQRKGHNTATYYNMLPVDACIVPLAIIRRQTLPLNIP